MWKKRFITLSVIWCIVASTFMTFGPTASAAMLSSRMQTEKTKAQITALLNSELIRESVKKFGFSEKEAVQIEKAFQDEKFSLVLEKEVGKVVVREVSESEKVVDLSQINLELIAMKLEESLDKNIPIKLLKKMAKKGKAFAERREASATLIPSQLSSGDISLAETYVQLQQSLTGEKLIALGMNREDARQVVAQMSKADMQKLTSGIKIRFASGKVESKVRIDWGRWRWLGVGLILAVVLNALALASQPLNLGIDESVWIVAGVCLLIGAVIWVYPRKGRSAS